MKKFVLKPGIRGLFEIDTESNEVDVIDYIRTNIDWVYQVPEDGELEVVDNDLPETKSVKKGDLIVQFYRKDGMKHLVTVLKDKVWKENIKSIAEYKPVEIVPQYCGECCDDCEASC